MAGKKGADNSKKAAGQARKAEAAAKKNVEEDAKKAAVEDADWDRGAKNSARKEAQAAKKAEQAKKKADRDAALAEEEKSLPTRAGPKNSKTAVKKTNRGLDNALSELNLNEENKLAAIETSGIDNILEVLGMVVSGESDDKIDRNATKRVGAAYAAFEEKRLKEMKEDGTAKAMRLSSRKEQIRKEFANSPENPLRNRLNVKYNATKEEIKEIKQEEKARVEALYTAKSSN
ncbi:hypothetical protein F4781DRAFT_394698 [Annulohypoxylon bovei var. microspora]|nr:hypothetical protein F4781DRAFT_394698 [Annulohypoxylon bovei var. microspora]